MACFTRLEIIWRNRKNSLLVGCRITITKIRVNNSTKRKFAVCKVLQHGDWAGVLDYEKTQLLPAEKKRSVVKVLNVKSVDHKEHKRKFVLAEDGTVYNYKVITIEA